MTTDLLWTVIATMGVIGLLLVFFLMTLAFSQRRHMALQSTLLHEVTAREERFRGIFLNSLVGIFRWSITETRFLEANNRMLTILGVPSLDDLNAPVPGSPHQVRAVIDAVVRPGEENRTAEISISFPEKRTLSLSVRRIESDGVIDGVLVDVTEQKKAEEMLREFSQHLMSAQETERRRIAQELHDGVNQLLSSARHRLLDTSARTQQKARMARASDLVQDAITEVRRISYNLRPRVLEDLGLEAAVRNTADEFVERTGIRVETHISRIPRTLPAEAGLAVFRVVQESLNNIEKHSRARDARIDLSIVERMLTLRIRDDGVGLPSTPRAGLGLIGMKERVSSVGGRLELHTTQKKGLELLVSIPLSRRTKGKEPS